jgi:rod shape-determining protein MreD
VKYLISLIVASFLAMLGVSAMPYVRVLGITPDFVLIFAACWAVVRGHEEALVVTPLAGLAHDLTGSDPLGTAVLAMAPVAWLAAAVRLRSVDSQFLPTVVVVGSGSLLYSVISMTVLAGTGQNVDWVQGALRVVIPFAVVNALFTPILYLPVRWFSPATQPRLLGAGRITAPLS